MYNFVLPAIQNRTKTAGLTEVPTAKLNFGGVMGDHVKEMNCPPGRGNS